MQVGISDRPLRLPSFLLWLPRLAPAETAVSQSLVARVQCNMYEQRWQSDLLVQVGGLGIVIGLHDLASDYWGGFRVILLKVIDRENTHVVLM